MFKASLGRYYSTINKNLQKYKDNDHKGKKPRVSIGSTKEQEQTQEEYIHTTSPLLADK
jgi:hypothetical protein